MQITFQDINGALSLALTIVSGLAIFFRQLGIKNKYFNAIAMAAAAASKAVNQVAYSDDATANKAREDFGILVLSKLIPNFDDATARTDLQDVFATIHEHSKDLQSAAAAPSIAVIETSNVAPQPDPVAVLKTAPPVELPLPAGVEPIK